jgi:hypothetical protein
MGCFVRGYTCMLGILIFISAHSVNIISEWKSLKVGCDFTNGNIQVPYKGNDGEVKDTFYEELDQFHKLHMNILFDILILI